MTRKTKKIQTCKQLLDTFYAKPRITKVEKLAFSGVGNRDVYNITAPFLYDGEEVILGRVEERDSEFSQVFFFTCNLQEKTPIIIIAARSDFPRGPGKRPELYGTFD